MLILLPNCRPLTLLSSSRRREVCSLKCCLLDVPGGVAEEVAEVRAAFICGCCS